MKRHIYAAAKANSRQPLNAEKYSPVKHLFLVFMDAATKVHGYQAAVLA